MKIRKVACNNKKRCFEIRTPSQIFSFPYSRLRIRPTETDRICKVFVDKELNREAFSYSLASGKGDTIPLDAVLEYNQHPDFLREMLLYKLTLKAQDLLKSSKVSRREIIRRLGTSPTQFYRLMDQSFYNKSIDQMVRLLAALDCPVELSFKKAA